MARERAIMRRLISTVLLLEVTTSTLAQDLPAEAAYCSDLKRVASLAMLGVGFSSISGNQRDGNFRDTTLPLRGWKECSLYGPGTYTCDSPDLESAGGAERTQAAMARQIIACLANTWSQVKDHSVGGALPACIRSATRTRLVGA